MKNMCVPHIIFDQQLCWGWVWGNHIIFGLPCSERWEKYPKKKKNNQTIFTVQSTTQQQLQQSSSSTERAGTGPSIPDIPPFPHAQCCLSHLSSLVSVSAIHFFPVTVFSTRNFLSDNLRRPKKPK